MNDGRLQKAQLILHETGDATSDSLRSEVQTRFAFIDAATGVETTLLVSRIAGLAVTAGALSYLQRLLDVRNDVVDVLQSRAHPHESIGNANRRTFLHREFGMRRGGWVRDD